MFFGPFQHGSTVGRRWHLVAPIDELTNFVTLKNVLRNSKLNHLANRADPCKKAVFLIRVFLQQLCGAFCR